jgi:hypothetical protein
MAGSVGMTEETMVVRTVISVPGRNLFDLLADPSTHVAIDHTRLVAKAAAPSRHRVLAVRRQHLDNSLNIWQSWPSESRPAGSVLRRYTHSRSLKLLD